VIVHTHMCVYYVLLALLQCLHTDRSSVIEILPSEGRRCTAVTDVTDM
jgi:hypothetical protein